MDVIEIDDLRMRCVIGCSDEERRDRQDVLVQLRVRVDARAAGRSDDLADAWNYRPPTKSVIRAAEGRTWSTVEALATEIARIAVMEHHASHVRVRVHKPGALRFSSSVGLVIERGAEDFAVVPSREAVASA